MPNYQRWIKLSYAGLAALVWLVLRQIADAVWDLLRLRTFEELPLSPADAVGLAGAILFFVILSRNAKVNAFANDVAVELAKVTWAPGKETMVSTGVISVVVGICSIILFIMDTVWGTFVKLMYQ